MFYRVLDLKLGVRGCSATSLDPFQVKSEVPAEAGRNFPAYHFLGCYLMHTDTENSGEGESEDEHTSLSGSDSAEVAELAVYSDHTEIFHLSHNARHYTKWTFTATFHYVDKSKLPSEQVVSSAVKDYKAMFAKCSEVIQRLGKRFLIYIFVVYQKDSAQSPANAGDDTDERLYLIPIRGYLECKRTTVENLLAIMPEQYFPDIHCMGLQSDLYENIFGAQNPG